MSTLLQVLIIDRVQSSGDFLQDSLRLLTDMVSAVTRVNSLPDARKSLETKPINSIFIDPLSFGLEDGVQFVFNLRSDYPNIVFVLYVSFPDVQKTFGKEFYAGERKRLNHYYKLNKATPAAAFKDELVAVVKECQGYLGYYVKASEIKELQSELKRIEDQSSGTAASVPVKLLTEIRDQINSLNERLNPQACKPERNSVFLSFRFAEQEYVEGLTSLLENSGFVVVTGQDASGYISRSILDRIGNSEFFLCLMTKDKPKADGTYTTSPWLLEEKGAALAMNKRIVLMVEEGIAGDEIGGLQGDWQRIHFTPKGFTKAALSAVKQLRTYVV